MDLRDASIFAAVCKAEGLPEPVFEHLFAKSIGRKWRFDVAFPDEKIAVEFEGVVFYGGKISRHQTARGYAADCEKYREAAMMGWIVLRYTQSQQDQIFTDLKRVFYGATKS